jgi:hypothetical protein
VSKVVSRDQINYRKFTDRPSSKAGSDNVGTIKVSDIDERKLAQGKILRNVTMLCSLMTRSAAFVSTRRVYSNLSRTVTI